jgi:replicative DNA helicase
MAREDGVVTATAAATGALTNRIMPESLAAEAAVLGSMVIDPACIGQVIELLDRNAFYRVEHQMIFDAGVALYEKNRPDAIDGVLVRDELEKRNQIEAIGGVEYLAKVIESVPSSANVMYYAGIVRDKQLLRYSTTHTMRQATRVKNLTRQSVRSLPSQTKK